MNSTLNILGASARAAAASAVRAGFTPCAVDLFADVDTQAIATMIRIADYPAEFLTAARELPDAPWIYTGGLENYPELIDAIAVLRPLWGNAGDVLRAVRDPLVWSSVLRDANIRTPNVTRDHSNVPREGTWLEKPLRSAGGLNIRVVDTSTEFPIEGARDTFFQQCMPGISASAVFVAARHRAVLLGMTQQLSGAAWTGAAPFLYCGSIGPLRLGDELTASVAHLGGVLADAFALTGLFGVDGILNDEGFWPIEINPRYVASIEILERASGAHFLQLHADACQQRVLPQSSTAFSTLYGKAILYASHDTIFSPPAADWVARANAAQAWPVVADIPRVGEPLPAGSPVATLLATGSTPEEVAHRLQARCTQLRAALQLSLKQG